MEVVPGIQKFVIQCNWKFTVDNLFDWYHPSITHMSAFNSGILPGANPEMIDPSETIRPDGAATPDGTEMSIPGGGASRLGDRARRVRARHRRPEGDRSARGRSTTPGASVPKPARRWDPSA